MKKWKWFRALMCILLVCCICFNMVTTPVRAVAVVDDIIAIVAAAILCVAGVVMPPRSESAWSAIGNSFQTYMYQWGTEAEKLDEVEEFFSGLQLINFDGGDENNPRNTQVKLAKGLLAGITAWIASVCFAGVEVETEAAPEGFAYYNGHLLPLIDLDDVVKHAYVWYDSTAAQYKLYKAQGDVCFSVDSIGRFCPPGYHSIYRYSPGDAGWTRVSSSTSTKAVSNSIVWANHDLYQGDTLFFSTSDPVDGLTDTLDPELLAGDVAPGLQDGSKAEEDIELPDTLELGNTITSNATAHDDLLHTLDQIAAESKPWKDALKEMTAEDSSTETETLPALDGTTVGDADAGSFLDRLGNLIKQPFEWLGSHLLSGLKDLFVPTQAQMEGIKDQWDQLLKERFGAAYEAVGLIDEWAVVFQDQEAITTLEFPRVTIPLLGSDQFVFGGWMVKVVPDGFDFLITALKRIISIICTFWFVHGMRSRFEGALGGH